MVPLVLGLVISILGGGLAPNWCGAATRKDKSLFVAVGNSYGAAVTEFNVVIDSFSACTAVSCIASAIEGAGDTAFYKAGKIPVN